MLGLVMDSGSGLFYGSRAVMRSIQKNLIREKSKNTPYYQLYSHKTDLIQVCQVRLGQVQLGQWIKSVLWESSRAVMRSIQKNFIMEKSEGTPYYQLYSQETDLIQVSFVQQLCLYMANFLTIRQFHFKLITQCSQLMDFARNLVCCRYKYQELLIQGQYGTNMTQ